MISEWVPDVRVVLFLVVCILVALAMRSRLRPDWPRETLPAPRDGRRVQRWLFPLYLVVLGPLLYQTIRSGGSWSAWLAVGAFALAAVLTGYQAFFHRFGDKEIAVNYGLDPGHCGRCGYDLTGNTSGVCPECAWRIPGPDHQWERPMEYARLRPWRIPYLHNWRWGLFGTILFSGMFLFWVVVAAKRGYWHFVAVVGALAVLPMIQAVRVASYGLRHRRAPTDEPAED